MLRHYATGWSCCAFRLTGHVWVVRKVWVHNLGEHGWLDWTHARSLVQIERVVFSDDGKVDKRGVRIWATTLSGLTLKEWASICRGHWGCENQQHWVADTHFGEDKRASVMSQRPEGLLVVSILRALAINL